MKFKDSIKNYVFSQEGINLTEDEELFVEIIKDAIFKEVERKVSLHGGCLDTMKVTFNVTADVTYLHSIMIIERYFKEVEEFVSFKMNILGSVVKSKPKTGNFTFSFTAVIY